MTNAAPPAPASTSDTQAANGNGATQAPAAPSVAGTDTRAPAASQQQGAVQTEKAPGAAGADGQQAAAAAVTQPAAAAPAPVVQTREEIEAEIKRDADNAARAKALQERQDDLRTFRRQSPIQARDALDELGEQLGIQIPTDLRKPILDLIDTANLKSYEAAKLEVADEAGASNQVVSRVSRAFYDAFATPEEKREFSDGVKGKDEAGWVNEFAVRQQASGRVNALGDMVEEGAKLLGEAYRPKFAEEVGKAEDFADLLKAYGTALKAEWEATPRGEPRIGGGGAPLAAGAEPRNMREVRVLHSQRQMTTAQMRDYQSRTSRGQFPE